MFFYTLCKGGGVEPMCKNLSCRFLQFWRPSYNLKLTQKLIFKAKIVTHLLKVFFPQIFALLCWILSRQTFTHFLIFMSKNPQHDCVKPRGGGGSRAVYTMCKKTSVLVEDGFPLLKDSLPPAKWSCPGHVKIIWWPSYSCKSSLKLMHMKNDDTVHAIFWILSFLDT